MLGRGEVTEGLVGADPVVRVLPVTEGRGEGGEVGLGVGDLVELLGVGPVDPLDPGSSGARPAPGEPCTGQRR